MAPSALQAKVQQQARKLLVQQQSLMSALEYSQLLERRLRQLVPDHPLPLTPEMAEESELDSAMTEPSARLAAARGGTLDDDRARAQRRGGVRGAGGARWATASGSRTGGEPPVTEATAAAASSGKSVARPTAASRRRQQEASRPSPPSSASASSTFVHQPMTCGWCSTGGAKAAASSSTAGSGAPAKRPAGQQSIESLRLERTKLQNALRDSREEVANLKRTPSAT